MARQRKSDILNKEISQESVATIDIEGENSKICAFNKNIGIKKILKNHKSIRRV